MIPCLPAILNKIKNFDLSNLTYIDSFTSPRSANTDNINLSNDATKFYFTNTDSNLVIQYDFLTKNILSTLVDNNITFTTSPESANTHAFTFSDNEDTLYIQDVNANSIFTFPLSVPGDITSIVRPPTAIVTNTPSNVTDIKFVANGNKLRMATTTGIIYNFDLPLPYDITNVLTPTDTYNLSPTQDLRSLVWSSNELLIGGRSGIYLDRYVMSTTNDINTLLLVESVDVTTTSQLVNGLASIAISRDNKYLYSINSWVSNNFTITQYSL